MSKTCMQSINFIHPMASEKNIFFILFFLNFPIMSPWQPFILSDLDKSQMKRGGLFNKYFFKKSKYPK